MERNKRDLEAVVTSQKEQLARYEKRLKDVVTAYKGLLKEKEALETSLAALSKCKEPSTQIDNTKDESDAVSNDISSASSEDIKQRSSEITQSDAESSNLKTQILTLMNSLATLSAEKSRMEASFQADKKQLRAQLDQKEHHIGELKAKIKENDERNRVNVEEVKAKWIIERQEREKETNNQMLMIRELQKLYADERHLKENIEMQLNNFKTQFASNEAESNRVRELQSHLKEARDQLKQLQATGKRNTSEDENDSTAVLRQVQQEMQQLKEQHAVAIRGEQRRVLMAEEQSRKQAALHENRVANLEARLAELSSTVGRYDRLRQEDQDSIHALKRKLQELDLSANSGSTEADHGFTRSRRISSSVSAYDIAAIVDEIMRLKKLLLAENSRTANPIDISKILNVGTDHVQCQEELKRVQTQCEKGFAEIQQMQEKVQVQKSHIHTLQEKVKVLNRNIEEQELELKNQGEKLRQAVKDERVKWKDALAEIENDCRCKVNDLEQQLQKQRQRSLQLLDEKEDEIKTLQTSLEVFHTAIPVSASAVYANNLSTEPQGTAFSSDGESIEGGPTVNSAAKMGVRPKKLSVGENCHMLHYANEIARKDIEIVGLRKAKYAAETSLRKAIHEKVTAQEELCDKIAVLEEQVDRLERCKTREGANLEYLKNVIISYMVTKDIDGKRHMMNAISAVLQFTPVEIQIINAAFQK